MSLSNLGWNDFFLSLKREIISGTGSMGVHLDSQIAGEDIVADVLKVENRNSFLRIISTASTTVKTGSGFFHALVHNSGRPSSCQFTIYDNTAASGTVIAVIGGTTTEAASLIYDASFGTGLTIVASTAITTADITITYR